MAEAAAFPADVVQAVCHHMDTDHAVAALRLAVVALSEQSERAR